MRNWNYKLCEYEMQASYLLSVLADENAQLCINSIGRLG